jgi:hypothetical protein
MLIYSRYVQKAKAEGNPEVVGGVLETVSIAVMDVEDGAVDDCNDSLGDVSCTQPAYNITECYCE